MERTLTLTPVPEKPLVSPPLAKVVMQVRYSLTSGLTTDAAEHALADALGRYPVRRRILSAAMPSIVIGGQPIAPRQENVLQFSSTKDSWRVAISESSVSLETSEYESRADFLSRAGEVFQAIAAVQLPPVIDRVGLRYVDRLVGENLQRAADFVVPELRGLTASLDPNLQLVHSITDSVIQFEEQGQLQVRSGLLPAGGTFDPLLTPVPEPSWVLDMDVYTTVAGFAFDSDVLVQRLTSFAEVAYACFRFALNDEFQSAYSPKSVPAASGNT